MNTSRMHWVNRILLAALVAALVAFGPKQLELAAESDDLARVTAERDGLVTGNTALREEIRLLEAEVAALESDPAEVARIAREDLNLVMPGEVVFEVEHVAAPASAPAPEGGSPDRGGGGPVGASPRWGRAGAARHQDE